MKIETKNPGFVGLCTIGNQQYLHTYEDKFIPVANDLTFNDLEIIDTREVAINTPYKIGTFKELASNGKDYYDIISDGVNVSCNCTGYGYRKKCKHTDKFMNENKIM